MGESFLALTNHGLVQANEQPLTAYNFNSAGQVHLFVKETVNRVLNQIYSYNQAWPFLRRAGSQILTPGEQYYNLPDDCMVADWSTFCIAKNENLDPPVFAQPLAWIDFNDWAQNQRWMDENMQSQGWGIPTLVTQRDYQFIVSIPPSQAVTVEYQYWYLPANLAEPTDICRIPPQYTYAVQHGIDMYVSKFLGDPAASSSSKRAFEDAMDTMRRALIVQAPYMRDRRFNYQLRRGGYG